MINLKAAASTSWRTEAARFARYGVVGAVGFVADAGILMGLVHGFGFNPILARFFSFSVAVVVTFELSRRWAFVNSGQRPLPSAFATYLGVQGMGCLANFCIYTCGILVLPSGALTPLISLFAGAILGLVVNYMGASRVVFAARPDLRPSDTQ